jgi:hypothetical protein
MSDIASARRDPPADWRERLIAVLSADGISELPKVPKWRGYLIGFGKVFGWILIAMVLWFLIAMVIVTAIAFPLTYGMNSYEMQPYFQRITPIGALIATALVAWFVYPRMRRAARSLQQVKFGQRPTEVLRKAKHPPVLFLRSFNFDSITSAVPKWQDMMPINAAMPTAELNLVQMIFRHAPVIAIGRPGESVPPVGAVRFYARHDVWKQTVEAIVPLCQLVVWTTGHTEGLRWEIKHLLERVPPQELLLWLHVNVARFSKAERDSEWQKLREAYRDVFPKELPADAASMRFIAFKDDWTPIAIPGPHYRPSLWELIASWPKTYGLEPFLRGRLQ